MSGEDIKNFKNNDIDSSYTPPPKKSLDEIINADKEDESLQKHKKKLLGEAFSRTIIFDETDHRTVVMKQLALVVADHPAITIDLTGDKSQFKKQVFRIKEGVLYHLNIQFWVQREIVHGLKYVQSTFRLGIPVERKTYMIGSYPPKSVIQQFNSPVEEAPTGNEARGTYDVTSIFTDDDNHEHLKWEWSIEIVEDWGLHMSI